MAGTNGTGTVHQPIEPLRRTTAQLSSAERSEQMDNLIAHVNALTRQVNVLTVTLYAGNTLQNPHARLDTHATEVLARLDALERAEATRRSLGFWQRLAWLVRG